MALTSALAVTLGWVGCAESDTALVGGRCSLASDCKDGLVCVFEACSVACKSERDCKTGESCIRSANGAACKAKATCSLNSDCPGTQVCARDAFCRDACLVDRDCNGGQRCVNAVCAGAQDLVAGSLPDKLGGNGLGAPCILSTDCPGDYVCRVGRTCGPECVADRDCPSFYTCKPARAGGPGRCTPPASPAPLEDASSDANALPELVSIAAGQHHTCAVFSDGRVKCFGANAVGQLGLGDATPRGDNQGEMGDNLPFVDLGRGVRATSVAGGGFHTCAIVNQGSGLKCWGANDKGQLGIGDANHRGDNAGEMGDDLPFVDVGTGRTVKSVALGMERTCALLDNNQVKCWGSAEGGALGLENGLVRGTNKNDMGDNLPFVKLGDGRTVKALAAGALHTCAILDNDLLKCWGWGAAGSLGYGTPTSRGGNVGDMGNNLPYVDLGTTSTLTWIAAGVAHNCARTTDGRFLCWGSNAEGGLGLGDQANRGDEAQEMGTFLQAVQLGTNRSVRSATLGLVHSCTLLDNGLVKCFGGNARGQLNLGEVHSHGNVPNQMGDNLSYALLPSGRTAVMIAAGWEHTCAYLDDRQLRCWGRNDFGQLGIGETRDIGVQPGESGDLSPPTILVGSP